MSKIILVKGNSNSDATADFLLPADEQCYFGIQDLYSESDTDILIWKLTDEKGTLVKDKKTTNGKKGKWNEKLLLSINKQLSGNYRYTLEASYHKKGGTTVHYDKVSIGGYCKPLIINHSANVPSEITPQKIRSLLKLETEGLNGNKLFAEIEFDNQCSVKACTCVEGTATFDIEFNAQHLLGELNKSTFGGKESTTTKQLKIKVKDANDEYIKDSSGKTFLLEKALTVKMGFTIPPFPVNVVNSSVYKAEDVDMDVNGIIELTSLKLDNTLYRVCNDINSGVKDIWILSDTTTGDLYHWMKKRETIDNNKKPKILPVAFESNLKPKINAGIDCLLDVNNAKVRLVDPLNNFQFDIQKISMKKGDPTTILIFESKTSFNKIAHFKNYKFELDYSLDNEITLMPLRRISFEFYIIHNASKYKSRDIPETLLYVGCRNNHNKSNTISEKDLLMNIFSEFSRDKKVFRRRELDIDNKRPDGSFYINPAFARDGMGYWRGVSSLSGAFIGVKRTGTLHDLLNYGEARCGEWTEFLIGVTKVQGLAHDLESIAICTDGDSRSETTYSFQSQANRLGNKIYKSNFERINSLTFAVKNAQLSDVNDPYKTTGNSAGMGNLTAQPCFSDHVLCYHPAEKLFLDPSYGTSCEHKLSAYCSNNLSNIYLSKANAPVTAHHPITGVPTGIGTVRKTNSITNTNIHEYLWSDRKLF